MKMRNQVFEIANIDVVEITVDVSFISKTGDVFFNATEIARQFGKLPKDFLRLVATQEYISEILDESGKENSPFKELVRTIKGGKHQGTWLHKELAFEFAGWCSPAFRRKLHKWTESRLQQEQKRVRHLLELKTGFLPLTNAIQSAHSDIKPYHFSNECNLINKLVTGMTARKFKETFCVGTVREALNTEQLELMEKLQRQDTCLIELGFDYQQRKQLLEKQVSLTDKSANALEAEAAATALVNISMRSSEKPTYAQL
jgi:hypothetical protein